jgi:hypothetical protein
MISSDWLHIHTRQGRRHMTWVQWHIYFSHQQDLFTLYVNLPRGEALASNWQEAGVHSKTSPGRPDYPLLNSCPIQVGAGGGGEEVERGATKAIEGLRERGRGREEGRNGKKGKKEKEF